jgi:hypothetical protein
MKVTYEAQTDTDRLAIRIEASRAELADAPYVRWDAYISFSAQMRELVKLAEWLEQKEQAKPAVQMDPERLGPGMWMTPEELESWNEQKKNMTPAEIAARAQKVKGWQEAYERACDYPPTGNAVANPPPTDARGLLVKPGQIGELDAARRIVDKKLLERTAQTSWPPLDDTGKIDITRLPERPLRKVEPPPTDDEAPPRKYPEIVARKPTVYR